ncbi:Lipid II:glycine glycyltransferase (Peptidoglycan interpeptide bridge formation enzyme) [Porphyromonadaceae bacterium NLAE-zl-C104]|uniref:lipid II:glycine glycyltransferase FemX n=1 Tax=Proteiniphilum saccharofermentans TaxID=1642647 RepID=UPI0008998432|nr:peptidoglycan bridge formation glycyltransferase FemA/FemB family protein [Proteiniphilum saccharofermentans]SEA04573.1 Lipid II:glycine glycyltransferase (Peptidoglycan interpeptide bridge formation enzyme) [Porphyromonadaceae bacterium KH3R12]SFS45148.1 Lipid II:glycine glycyltransferase (Peptidoglycan interpeptide bridge formation enzyme) [Porphyromonadaceae bacterium NLAE-zl-C104]
MLTNVCLKETEELYATPILQQTAFWSEVKTSLGANTLAVNFTSQRPDLFPKLGDQSYIKSDLLVILQQINRNHSVAYVPYGPEIEPADEFQGMFLEELSESLRSVLPSNCIHIRYDLCWESYWAREKDHFDENGIWKGEPESLSQELRFNFSTHNWNFKKAHSNILPANTIYLDLTQDKETLLQRMKPKTRYNIKLAQRKGVTVRSMGMEGMDIWYELYKETAIRNHLLLNDIKYFRAVLDARADNTSSPADVSLLIAEYDEKPLAAMFLVITGNRGSYLYGASSSSHRNLMATYALQWEAIMRSQQAGCTEYDMFGISPSPDPEHPLYGLYKFKSGFGGEIYHSLGCWDYPLDKETYSLFRASELRSQGYHLS